MGQYFKGFCEDCEESVDLNKLSSTLLQSVADETGQGLRKEIISKEKEDRGFRALLWLAFTQKHNGHKIGIRGDEGYGWGLDLPSAKGYREIWPKIWNSDNDSA